LHDHGPVVPFKARRPLLEQSYENKECDEENAGNSAIAGAYDGNGVTDHMTCKSLPVRIPMGKCFSMKVVS
jgi:hypothetical protein